MSASLHSLSPLHLSSSPPPCSPAAIAVPPRPSPLLQPPRRRRSAHRPQSPRLSLVSRSLALSPSSLVFLAPSATIGVARHCRPHAELRAGSATAPPTLSPRFAATSSSFPLPRRTSSTLALAEFWAAPPRPRHGHRSRAPNRRRSAPPRAPPPCPRASPSSTPSFPSVNRASKAPYWPATATPHRAAVHHRGRLVAGLSIDLGAPQRIRPAAGHAPASTRRLEKRRGKGRRGDGGRRAL